MPLFHVDRFLYPTLVYANVIGCFIYICIEVQFGSLTGNWVVHMPWHVDDIPELWRNKSSECSIKSLVMDCYCCCNWSSVFIWIPFSSTRWSLSSNLSVYVGLLLRTLPTVWRYGGTHTKQIHSCTNDTLKHLQKVV